MVHAIPHHLALPCQRPPTCMGSNPRPRTCGRRSRLCCFHARRSSRPNSTGSGLGKEGQSLMRSMAAWSSAGTAATCSVGRGQPAGWGHRHCKRPSHVMQVVQVCTSASKPVPKIRTVTVRVSRGSQQAHLLRLLLLLLLPLAEAFHQQLDAFLRSVLCRRRAMVRGHHIGKKVGWVVLGWAGKAAGRKPGHRLQGATDGSSLAFEGHPAADSLAPTCRALSSPNIALRVSWRCTLSFLTSPAGP